MRMIENPSSCNTAPYSLCPSVDPGYSHTFCGEEGQAIQREELVTAVIQALDGDRREVEPVSSLKDKQPTTKGNQLSLEFLL